MHDELLEVKAMPRYRSEWYPTIRECLERAFIVEDLRPLARVLAGVSQGKKEDLIRAILRTIAGDGLRAVFQRLHPLQQTALAETAHASFEGSFDAGRFSAKYGKEALETVRDLARGSDSLWLLFCGAGRIPDDLKARLKAFVPPPQKDRLRTLDRLPDLLYFEQKTGKVREIYPGDPPLIEGEGTPFHVRGTDRAARNNLKAVLILTEQGKIKVGPQTGHPSSAAMKAIARALDGGDWYVPGQELDEDLDDYTEIDPIQAFAWPLLLQGAGLANIEAGSLRLTRTGKAALNGDPAGTIRAIWKKWEKTTFFDEFSRVNAIRGQNSKGGRHMVSPAYRRPVINAALAGCPPGAWVSVDELGRYMVANDFLFEVTRDLWKLYISEAQYGSLGFDGFAPWSVVQGRYVLAYLFEYAATLGLVDVAYLGPNNVRDDFRRNWGTDDLPYLSRYDGLWYFRVNPLGAYALDLTPRYESVQPEASKSLKVLPNLEIVVVDRAGLSPADDLFLGAFAEKASDAVWRLTPRTLLDAAGKGTPFEDIVNFLSSRSDTPLPGTVTALLEDIGGRAARFTYEGRAHLLACEDPALVALAASDRTLSSLCLAAGERHLCILPGKEKAFAKALADLGYAVPHLKEMLDV